jgi:hypothetical protein
MDLVERMAKTSGVLVSEGLLLRNGFLVRTFWSCPVDSAL